VPNHYNYESLGSPKPDEVASVRVDVSVPAPKKEELGMCKRGV